MSVYATAYVWEHSTQKGSTLLLLLAIADIAHRNGVAFPSVRTLGRFTRMSERQVQRLLDILERSGELSIKRGEGPRGTHLFQIRMNQTLPLFGEGGGDKLSGDRLSGDADGQKGVTSGAKRGDTATSPEPEEPKTEPRDARALAAHLFEDFWKAYPPRAGNNPKVRAVKAWNARVREKVAGETMLSGAQRYARWCEATGKLNTEKVMMAATFLGTDRCFEQSWELPPPEKQAQAKGEPVRHDCVVATCQNEGQVSLGGGIFACAACYRPASYDPDVGRLAFPEPLRSAIASARRSGVHA